MEIDGIYEYVEEVHGPQTQTHSQDKGQAPKTGGCRCLVVLTVFLGLICVLLLVFVILQIGKIPNLIDTNQELESILKPKDASEQVCYTISNEAMTWSESRQYCRDRGADLIIINTEEKQRFITSLAKERLWIGLTDIENETVFKWVDTSHLNQKFWDKGEPNSLPRIEDCIELDPERDRVNNWNDLPCLFKIKCICEH
ncbi:C-type lectin domain family 4 member E-like isoform X3 [Pseudorasbora parva]|uniref:C-type lectin domain family 4 member E-like isoform X3 n=1 Tax=Pseudorasbora parva TaxID=51549 RepID=UPI00351DE7CD